MKAATGELNLTLITVVAIGAVLGIFTMILPTIKEKITGGFDAEIDDSEYSYYYTDYDYPNWIESDLF